MNHAATTTRPPHPASYVRDDRDTPLTMEAGWAIIHDFRKKEIEIFPRRGLTGVIGLKRQPKLVFWRGGFCARERLAMGLIDRQSNIAASGDLPDDAKADVKDGGYRFRVAPPSTILVIDGRTITSV